MTTPKNDMKTVLNLAEEPYLVYLDNKLVMQDGGWRHDMGDPSCGPDWIELIKKYKTFSGVEEVFQFTETSYEKYRRNDDAIPTNFNDFQEGEIVTWVPTEYVYEGQE